MTTELKQLEQRALRLPAEEREQLAQNLLQSINGQGLGEVDEAWVALADKRFHALKDGTDQGLSEEEFERRFR